jgi:hypothetical protein
MQQKGWLTPALLSQALLDLGNSSPNRLVDGDACHAGRIVCYVGTGYLVLFDI